MSGFGQQIWLCYAAKRMDNYFDGSRANAQLPRAGTRWRLVLTVAVLILIAYVPGTSVSAIESSKDIPGPSDVPAWAFPLNPPAPSNPAPFDKVLSLHVSNSKASFTEAELNDLFNAPDWHPTSHSEMPSIVADGRPPDVYACGFCHTPGGQGRPENASLAGLPAAYILSQVADFKSGARVPRSHVVGWVYVAEKDGGGEPLGQRLLEFAPDAVRHENRDDEMRYIAYVPLGSIDRGKLIAQAGSDSPANACSSCHGPQLRGVGLIPPIAGRSPTYILRQLLAFQTGSRSGATGLPMRTVVKNLKIGGLIDAAAYAASLPP